MDFTMMLSGVNILLVIVNIGYLTNFLPPIPLAINESIVHALLGLILIMSVINIILQILRNIKINNEKFINIMKKFDSFSLIIIFTINIFVLLLFNVFQSVKGWRGLGGGIFSIFMLIDFVGLIAVTCIIDSLRKSEKRKGILYYIFFSILIFLLIVCTYVVLWGTIAWF